MSERKIQIKISGVGKSSSPYLNHHDGQLTCNYLYVWNSANPYNSTLSYMSSTSATFNEFQKINDYSDVFDNSGMRNNQPIIINYTTDDSYNIKNFMGLYALVGEGNDYSFYRREYEHYERLEKQSLPNGGYAWKPVEYTFKGPWSPVAIKVNEGMIRDYNIKSDHTYQYIMYPSNANLSQVYANARSNETRNVTGDPVKVHWNCWSLTELIPIENEVDAPVLIKSYKADNNNVWFFKYSLETGEQTQNISKNEFQTLGQYSKVSHGLLNALSGSVSCMLGSEIIPYDGDGYVERLYNSIAKPLSTNEKAKMLQKWRQMVYSKNPKLLKDSKGQNWIVQVMSGSNTPYTQYNNQPDKISFTWKEIATTDNIVIYGSGNKIERVGGVNSQWRPKDTNN